MSTLAVLYGFVILVDPWDTLPLSPRLPRVPISSNARFSFPSLARSPAFDAAIIGTSTARLLQPAQLDPAFRARFVNLAMNSATAWEQAQLLQVFLRAHPLPKAILIDIDMAWCGPVSDRLTPRPFPDWMYGPDLWPAYTHMLTPYAVQEAANQFATMLHLKRRRYGLDGYTNFTPPEAEYDPVRVDAAFARWPATDQTPAPPGEPVPLPALAILAPALRSVPPATQVVLFFPPLHMEQQGEPLSRTAARWSACKQAVIRLAQTRGGKTEVQDLLRPSAITQTRASYWDPLHYRQPVAARLATLLAGTPGPEAVRLDH